MPALETLVPSADDGCEFDFVGGGFEDEVEDLEDGELRELGSLGFFEARGKEAYHAEQIRNCVLVQIGPVG